MFLLKLHQQKAKVNFILAKAPGADFRGLKTSYCCKMWQA